MPTQGENRSTMGQISGVTLMNINHSIDINLELISMKLIEKKQKNVFLLYVILLGIIKIYHL